MNTTPPPPKVKPQNLVDALSNALKTSSDLANTTHARADALAGEIINRFPSPNYSQEMEPFLRKLWTFMLARAQQDTDRDIEILVQTMLYLRLRNSSRRVYLWGVESPTFPFPTEVTD